MAVNSIPKAYRLTFNVVASSVADAHIAVYRRLHRGGEADTTEELEDGFADTEERKGETYHEK